MMQHNYIPSSSYVAHKDPYSASKSCKAPVEVLEVARLDGN